jgi:hypothetical protein
MRVAVAQSAIVRGAEDARVAYGPDLAYCSLYSLRTSLSKRPGRKADLMSSLTAGAVVTADFSFLPFFFEELDRESWVPVCLRFSFAIVLMGTRN